MASISSLSVSDWTSAVKTAASEVRGDNSTQNDQMKDKLSTWLSARGYDYAYLICALEDDGGGYRSYTHYGNTAGIHCVNSGVHKDGEHWYQAWVLGK